MKRRNLPLLTPLYLGIAATGFALSSLLIFVPKLLHDLDESEREWRAMLREWNRDSEEMWSVLRHEADSLPSRHKRGYYTANYHSGSRSGYATPPPTLVNPYEYQPALPPPLPQLPRLRCCCDYEETKFALSVSYNCPLGQRGPRGNQGEGGLAGIPGQPGVNGVDYPRLLEYTPSSPPLSAASDFPQPSPFPYSGAGGIASALMKYMRDPVGGSNEQQYVTQSSYRGWSNGGGQGGYCGACPSGRAGPPGVQGKPGLRGAVGWPGSRGIPGLPGQSGGEGERGDVGPRGRSGRSALPGQRGADGVKGAIGRPGAKGSRGATGLSGARGSPGSAGRNGYVGQRGHAGPFGVKGQSGMDGVDGIQGVPGVPGRDALYCKCPNRGGYSPNRDGATTVYEVSGGNRGAFSTTNYTYPPSPSSSYLKQIYVTTGINQPPSGGSSYGGGAPRSTESAYPTPPVGKVPYPYPTSPSAYAASTPRPSTTHTPYRPTSLAQQPLPQHHVWYPSASAYNHPYNHHNYYNANGVSRKVYPPPRLPPIDRGDARKVRDGETAKMRTSARGSTKQMDTATYRAEIEDLFADVDLDRSARNNRGTKEKAKNESN